MVRIKTGCTFDLSNHNQKQNKMATTQTQPKTKPETQVVKPVNNAKVSASKQIVTDEGGEVVKTLYYIKIQTEQGEMQINTGEKNYEMAKKLSTEKA